MVSAGGISFHLRRCPQELPLYFVRKPPFLGPLQSKLDHLTVLFLFLFLFFFTVNGFSDSQRGEKKKPKTKIKRKRVEKEGGEKSRLYGSRIVYCY
jgi:hypothetical protein